MEIEQINEVIHEMNNQLGLRNRGTRSNEGVFVISILTHKFALFRHFCIWTIVYTFFQKKWLMRDCTKKVLIIC